MTRQNGTHVEYERSNPDTHEPQIVRVFPSRVAALESAVENLNGAVYIEFGDTIAEALAKAETAKNRTGNTGPKTPSSGVTAAAKTSDIPEGRP